MRRLSWNSSLLGIALVCATAACGGSSASGAAASGQADVTIGDKAFAVNNVLFDYSIGEDGYFRLEGDDAAHPSEDCLPGLGGGLSLYGSLPSDVTTIADLSGRELPLEFSGDGDDFNLCFVGSNGLLGVEHGTMRFTVNGNRLSFTFSGRFRTFDGQGGESSSTVAASGSGAAPLSTELPF